MLASRTRSLALLLALAILGSLLAAPPARAVGEASTRFGIFVPPSANPSRDPTLVVTAVRDGATVTITDDGADGDTDDTVANVPLSAGQSYILHHQEGAVNDDAGGKADGDFFLVTATQPVVVANLTVNTDWQHEFVPADNRRMAGTSFFLYRPRGADQTASRNELLNVIAYSDNTALTILDITAAPKTSSGVTTVVPDAQGVRVFSYTLQAGQDLQEVNGQRVRLDAGRTYRIISNKDVTVMFGALGKGQQSSRDGGGYVPGKSGFSADKTFYFAIPYYLESERELRLVAYRDPADVTVRGWNTAARRWDTIATYPLAPYGHAELIGAALGPGYYFFEVTSSATISVFETNWLETTNSSYQTADIATFISAEDGTGAGRYFLAYIGPPGLQPDGRTSLSHLYVSANQPANVIVYDPDSYGEYIELYNGGAEPVDLSGWTLTNAAGRAVTLPAGARIGARSTFLLEFHERATNAPASFVYGPSFSRFKLANTGDTVTLRRGDGAVVDQASFGGVGSGAIERSLERIDPARPFGQGNARDATTFVPKSAANLGSYFGTPGAFSGGASGVVVSEVLAGRILRRYSIPANGYADVQITVAEWEGINNGEPPLTNSGNPENPYLVVESDTPVSVMNSNWNDNWLTYGTGILQPDPYVSHVADYYRRRAGEPVVFTTYVQTVYGALLAPRTEVSIPAGIAYTPGSYRTPGQLAAVTPSETRNQDGSWTLVWQHDRPLAPGEVYRFEVRGTIEGGQAQDAALRSTAHTRGTDQGGANLYSSQDTAVVTVGADEPALLGEVVINEVMPAPGCAEAEWVELYNRGASDVNIGGWELSDEDGFVYRVPPDVFLPRDGYLTVSLGAGQDAPGMRFAGRDVAGALGDDEDQLALYRPGGRSAANMVDFVQWGGASLRDGADDDAAAAVGMWPSGAAVPAPALGVSLGRDRSARDTNTAADWDATGGPSSEGVATPGAVNLSIPGVDAAPPPAVAGLAAAAVTERSGAIRLTWANPASGDLAGVKIVRSADAFPRTVGDGTLVYDGLAGGFEDRAPSGRPAYYAAFAYDDSGNVACAGPAAQARAVAPQRILLAYEDLKDAAWVDWDMNDFVIDQVTAVDLAAEGVARIETRITAAARGSTFDHTLGLTVRLSGRSTVLVERFDAAGALTAREERPADGSVTVEVFTSTQQALPAPAGTTFANTVAGAPSVAGASVRVVITPERPADNPPETLHPAPFDPWLRVRETGATVRPLQAGALGNTQRVRDGLGPMSGRDLPLALAFEQAWRWPLEMTPIWDAYPQYAAFTQSGGQRAAAWYTAPSDGRVWGAAGVQAASVADGQADTLPAAKAAGGEGVSARDAGGAVFASPVAADLDGDGRAELLAATQAGAVHAWRADGSPIPGWPQQAGALVRGTPAVGDLDGDGRPEVVVGGDDGRLHAWRADGSAIPGFPAQLGGPLKASPALANLDADPALEVVAHAGDNRLALLDGDGRALPGWPRQLGGTPDRFGGQILGSTPAAGDLDGDGRPEIVVGSTDGAVYAFRLDGAPLTRRWPQATGDAIASSPVIVDLDRDGLRDVVAASGDGRVYAWRADGLPLAGFPADLRAPVVASPAVADLDGDADLELVVATAAGRVHALHHGGAPLAGWPRDAGAGVYSSPAVGDLDGDGRPEVLVGALDGGLYAWGADGIPAGDWPRRTGDWLAATPLIGDLDGDGAIEVAAGSYDGKVYVWDAPGAYRPEAVPWAGFRGGPLGGVAPGSAPASAMPREHEIMLPLVRR